jgi:hypothetical protein
MKVCIIGCNNRLLMEGDIEPSTRVPALGEHIVHQNVEFVVNKVVWEFGPTILRLYCNGTGKIPA